MKILSIFLSLIALTSCIGRLSGGAKENGNKNTTNWKLPDISAIDAKFPLSLIDINLLDSSNLVVLNDGITSQIRKTIIDYYFYECAGDSNEVNFTVKDTYINTIRLHDSLQTIFVILFHHIPSGMINCKILFYDNTTKEFADRTLDFNIHALYNFENGILTSSNLRTDLNISTPEIELVDFDKNGVNDFKLSRLIHNGTLNEIETIVLNVSRHKIDTLDFRQQILKTD